MLKEKAVLLLQQEHELYSIRRARERISAWLHAFHRLSVEAHSAASTDLLADWVNLMLRDLDFEVALVMKCEEGSGLLEFVCGHSNWPLPREIPFPAEATAVLRKSPSGVTRDGWPTLPDAIHQALGLDKFLWFFSEPHLLLTGFSPSGSSYQEIGEDDLDYFTMLGRHVMVLLKNMQLLALSKESNLQLQASLHTLQVTQAQLVQAAKMAAVGQLAAGVSHEINNPLAVILGFAQGMERRLTPAHEAFRLPVVSIVREALRCRNLVRELLTFSRVSHKSTDRIDLRTAVQGAGQLLESRARAQHTRLVLDICPEACLIQANPIQIEQVLVNLGNNALDALDQGGRLRLALCCRSGSAILEVEDDGPGIPTEVRSRIFEPFFTTKDPDKGTGLGLSLAYEIIQQHGGSIEITSEVDTGGTTMRVLLPLLQEV